MSDEIAFVGDVHGNLCALRALHEMLTACRVRHTFFLGDYINKGRHSAEVIEALLSYAQGGRITLLRGNHEDALIRAIDTGDLREFLKMGGAMTIRSYVKAKVGPDVLKEFRDRLPASHLELIRSMPSRYETNSLIAQHTYASASGSKFVVSAHIPVGNLPRIRRESAELDTGCGTKSGRLTGLLWPSLDYVQVDANGAPIAS